MLMMLPFEAPTIFEGIHKSYFRMPRVVKDQRGKFENDDQFRQLSHESAVKYTGFKDRPLEERQMKFITNCQEGHTELSVVQTGNQFTLMFNPPNRNQEFNRNPDFKEGCDFEKELGKVHIRSSFILNGVCVLWRGWIDLQRLEGFGCLEFDELRAHLEDSLLKQQIERLPPPPPPPLQQQPQPQAGQQQQSHPASLPPAVSLSNAAAHYDNATIAAAAAAAFHQVLGAPPPQSLHGLGVPQGQPMHGLGGPPAGGLHALAGSGPPPLHGLGAGPQSAAAMAAAACAAVAANVNPVVSQTQAPSPLAGQRNALYSAHSERDWRPVQATSARHVHLGRQ